MAYVTCVVCRFGDCWMVSRAAQGGSLCHAQFWVLGLIQLHLAVLLVVSNKCSWVAMACQAQQGEAGGRTSAERPHFRLYFLVKCVTLPCKNLGCWGPSASPASGGSSMQRSTSGCSSSQHWVLQLQHQSHSAECSADYSQQTKHSGINSCLVSSLSTLHARKPRC
jgi:hypothetical protein